MSGPGVLLDSCIVIDHLNGVSRATAAIRSLALNAHVSAITRAEVLAGVEGEERRTVAEFLDCFDFIPIDREVADLAADLRRTHRWRLPDAIQAAAAQRAGLRLATRNTRDFDPTKHQFVWVPYEVG